jgi:hypothetical protein
MHPTDTGEREAMLTLLRQTASQARRQLEARGRALLDTAPDPELESYYSEPLGQCSIPCQLGVTGDLPVAELLDLLSSRWAAQNLEELLPLLEPLRALATLAESSPLATPELPPFVYTL